MHDNNHSLNADEDTQGANTFLQQPSQPVLGYGVWLFLLALYFVLVAINKIWLMLRITVAFFEGSDTVTGPIGIANAEEVVSLLLTLYIPIALFVNISVLKHFVQRSQITPWLIVASLGLEELYNSFRFMWWWEFATVDQRYIRVVGTAIFLTIILYLFRSKHVKRVFGN